MSNAAQAAIASATPPSSQPTTIGGTLREIAKRFEKLEEENKILNRLVSLLTQMVCRCPKEINDGGYREVNLECEIHKPNGMAILIDIAKQEDFDTMQLIARRRMIHATTKRSKGNPGIRRCSCRHHDGHDPVTHPWPGCFKYEQHRRGKKA